MKLSEFEKSEDDLVRAARLEPGNRAVQVKHTSTQLMLTLTKDHSIGLSSSASAKSAISNTLA